MLLFGFCYCSFNKKQSRAKASETTLTDSVANISMSFSVRENKQATGRQLLPLNINTVLLVFKSLFTRQGTMSLVRYENNILISATLAIHRLRESRFMNSFRQP